MAAVLDDKTLRIVRVFNAPRERVFDAWVVQDNFIQWMCPSNVHVDEVKLDVQPGGAWHLRGRNASRNFVTSGRYVEVKRPEESKAHWDYLKVLQTIPAEKAFRPVSTDCSLVKK